MWRLQRTTTFVPLFLLIVHCFCDAHQIQHGMSDACNEYVDGIINDLKNDKEYFEDPYKMEEKSITFSKKLVFINYTAEATIKDGYVYGLPTLHREGDVVVDKGKKKPHLKVFLGAGEIKMTCSGKLKLMKHGPDVKVNAKITYISMKLDIVPNPKTGENPKVVGFGIEEAKGTDIKVSGLGPLGFFVKPYTKFMTTVFKAFIRKGIEDRIQKFMVNKFKVYVIPAACLNE